MLPAILITLSNIKLRNVNNKVLIFIGNFVIYLIIYLVFTKAKIGGKQIAEMIFIGTLVSFSSVLLINPTKRLIEYVLKKYLLP